MTYISFPGLGIKEFPVNPTAFTVFGIDIAWYGIIICFGLILGVLYSIFRANRNEGIKTDTVIDLAFFLVIFGVIGARLYYVIFKLGDYIKTKADGSFDLGKTLLAMINIREGGLAIYGGIIAGFITILVFAKIKKIKSLKILDFVSPAVMIGQLIGRWGNFMNAEAYGYETNLPWRMGISVSNFSDPSVSKVMAEGACYHPTFLYESLWNLIGFLIINAIYKKKKFDGQIFFMYIAWYGLGRAFIEGLRTDSLMSVQIRVSQLVGALSFIIGFSFLVFLLRYAVSVQKTRTESGSFINIDIKKRSKIAAPVSAEVSTLGIVDVDRSEESSDDVAVNGDSAEETDKNVLDDSETDEVTAAEAADRDEDDLQGSADKTDGDDNGEDN